MPVEKEFTRESYPGDVCPASRDSKTPTAFEVACTTVGVNSRHDQIELVNHEQFGIGWEVGVERDLGGEMFPGLHQILDDEAPGVADLMQAIHTAQRAFTLGLVCGLVAEQKGYVTPFCIFGHTEAEHEAAVAREQRGEAAYKAAKASGASYAEAQAAREAAMAIEVPRYPDALVDENLTHDGPTAHDRGDGPRTDEYHMSDDEFKQVILNGSTTLADGSTATLAPTDEPGRVAAIELHPNQ